MENIQRRILFSIFRSESLSPFAFFSLCSPEELQEADWWRRTVFTQTKTASPSLPGS